MATHGEEITRATIGPTGALTPHGPITTTSPGEVYDHLEISGSLDVEHDVTLTDCRIIGDPAATEAGYTVRHTADADALLTLINCEVITRSPITKGIVAYGAARIRAERTIVRGGTDNYYGKPAGTPVEGLYRHVFRECWLGVVQDSAGAHADVVQIEGGVGALFERCKIMGYRLAVGEDPLTAEPDGTIRSAGGILLTQKSSAPEQIDSVHIVDCWVEGAHWTVYLDPDDGFTPTNLRVDGCRWGLTHTYGPLLAPSGTVLVDNVWGQTGVTTTGRSVTAGQPLSVEEGVPVDPPVWVASSSGTGGTSAAAPAPAGLAENDIIVGVLSHLGAAEPSSPPTGMILKRAASIPGVGWAGLYWRRATGDETTIATSGATNSVVLGLAAYRGCIATGDPFDAVNHRVNDVSPMVGCDGIETSVGNTRIIATTGLFDNRNYSAWATTSPGALIEDLEVLNSTGNDTGVGIASQAKAGAGETGPLTLSYTWSPGVGFLAALLPAVDAPGDVSVTLAATSGMTTAARTVATAAATLAATSGMTATARTVATAAAVLAATSGMTASPAETAAVPGVLTASGGPASTLTSDGRPASTLTASGRP